MAQTKKTQTKKNTSKKPAPKKSAKAEKKQDAEVLENKKKERKRILGIAYYCLSLILFFVAVIAGEGVWLAVHNFYIGLFGWLGAIIFPLISLASPFINFKKRSGDDDDEESKLSRWERNFVYDLIMIVSFVLFISTFIHILINNSGDKFGDAVTYAYSIAPSSFNGGFFGALIGWLFLTFGKAPAIIVTLILMIADILIFIGILNDILVKKTKKVSHDTVTAVPNYIKERRERRMSDFDVFLDDYPDVRDNMNGDVRDNQDKKRRSKKNDDNLGDDDYSNMIREINETTRHNREERANPEDKKNKNKKSESLDDIVDKAQEDNKTEKKKDEKPPEFKVSDEDMNKGVGNYVLPDVSILKLSKQKSQRDISNELKTNARLLVDTLASFGVSAEITDISRGPTVTRYELKPAAGVRISKITNLADDIALNLAATNVRIEAPIPGKAAVGIEIPNTVKNSVSMREIIDTDEFDSQKSILSAGIGKDIAGNSVFCDIAKMPHLLIAGTTGSGKSVCMNSIIVSILYRAKPDEVKFLMIDPKKVEFSKYENIPHLLVPVVTDPRKASGALGWAVSEMLKRYQAFSDTGVRDIAGYNKFVKKHDDMEPMPKIVICIDELADLMLAAPKEVEDSICRLAQMARAAGMHLVIATQRPSVDVITGLIKANISSRIALTVSSAIDSRTILDTGGAEKLLGRGDMLYSPIGASKPLRVQGCFISDEEVESLCNYIKKQGESRYSEDIQKEIEEKAVQDKNSSPFTDGDGEGDDFDPLFEKAVETVLENGRASTSFLQRKLGVGYSRGSKIMDQLEEKGVIGPQDGAKPREIRINMQQWIQMKAAGSAADEPEFTAENTEQISFDGEEPAEETTPLNEDFFDNYDDEDF
ncbi:MAG: DUF87 domain-containing protein [Eubacterium sp.]|nr:DUF87 domain-containing protein [Eubacterium sp.]